MTTLQFSLFFAALILMYVLVHVRLARFDTHLRELGRLAKLEESLGSLPKAVEGVRLDDLQVRLGRIRDDLATLNATMERVEDGLARSAERAPAVEIPRVSAGDQIRSLIEGRLLQMGYRNVNLLTDLATASPDQKIEVAVECERNNLQSKGAVTVYNGSVRDVRLQNVTQMFP